MDQRILFEMPELSEIEILELQEELPNGTVTTEDSGGGSTTDHGDLGLTTAIVILSAAAIHGLAVWLAKRRVQTAFLMDASMKETPAERVWTIHVEKTGALSEPPSPEVVEALQSRLSDLLPGGNT
jgi:hypothetical protein